MLIAETMIARLPDVSSPLWWPARAIMGDWAALAGVLAVCFAVLGLVMAIFAPRLGEHSMAATDLAAPTGRRRRKRRRAFARRSAGGGAAPQGMAAAPPRSVARLADADAALLPHSAGAAAVAEFRRRHGHIVIVVMVLVTVGGQLAGALAWLAISGEDAPDLVATAPIPPLAITRAKVEAVMGAVGMVLAPFLAVFAWLSPCHAVAAMIGIAMAAASTIRIQLWFRAQAKRSHFRRRHTSSRIATFAEALTSFSWAAAAGLAAAGSWFAAISAVIALLILLGARSVSPRKAMA